MTENPVIPDPEDDESAIDGCDVEIVTSDENLPAAEGGVA